MEPSPAPLRTTAGQRVVVSIKAAFAGWLSFFLICLAFSIYSAVFNRYAWANSQNPFVPLFLFGAGSAVVIFAVWLIVALPLALFVSDSSVFWKPGVLPIVGIIAGILAVCLFQIYVLRSNSTIRIYDWNAYMVGNVLLPCLPSAFIGGVVGGAASAFHAKLRKG
jgi:hypothetical protein